MNQFLSQTIGTGENTITMGGLIVAAAIALTVLTIGIVLSQRQKSKS